MHPQQEKNVITVHGLTIAKEAGSFEKNAEFWPCCGRLIQQTKSETRDLKFKKTTSGVSHNHVGLETPGLGDICIIQLMCTFPAVSA